MKIILCLCNLNNDFHCWKLEDLFKNKINVINSHDPRWYIPARVAYEILVEGGYCLRVIYKNLIYKENITEDDLKQSFNPYINYFKWFTKYNFGYDNKFIFNGQNKYIKTKLIR